MKNKIILSIIFVIIIGLGIFFAFRLNSIENNNLNNQYNNIENTNINTNINKIENNVVNNTVNNTSTEEINTSTITNEEDKEQKAINIAKDNWGEDDTVTISFDEINNDGKYIVYVRDKATTKALYWYIIDIETGTFTIENSY